MTSSVLAVDLGATSGRVIEGRVGPNTLEHRVVHRFHNGPVEVQSSLHWNVSGLFEEILAGMATSCASGSDVVSVGVDSWAVDYGLLSQGRLLHEPFHYRDARGDQGVAKVHATLDHASLFAKNGLQFLPFNTIYQLAMEDWEGQSEQADALLLIPDLINYWLTGASFMERTNASTTGLLNVTSGELDTALLEVSGVDRTLFAPLIDAGTTIGPFTAEVASRVGFESSVVAVGSHDTASAVVAAPLRSASSAYISLGTWGLVGVETSGPILSDAARIANFTNECGVDGRNRFLRNVMGLWLLNESVSWWRSRGETRGLEQLLAEAAHRPSSDAVVEVGDPVFVAPGDVPRRIVSWCEERDIPVDSDPVAMVALIVDSLAVALASAVQIAGELSGVAITEISVVGGGSQNTLLNQRLANHAGIAVVAGPVEATALGNVLAQARSEGLITGDLDAMRALVRNATNLTRFSPQVPVGD